MNRPMRRENFPWLTDEQFRLCKAADDAAERMDHAAGLVCEAIASFGFDNGFVRERFLEWQALRQIYRFALREAEASRTP